MLASLSLSLSLPLSLSPSLSLPLLLSLLLHFSSEVQVTLLPRVQPEMSKLDKSGGGG